MAPSSRSSTSRRSSDIGTLATRTVAAAERAGTSLTKLVPNIQKTAELVQEVSAASREQAQSVGNIGIAMGKVDEVTQQNAAAAEELAAASEELSARAHSLEETIGFFKIGAAANLPTATPPQASHSGQFAVHRNAPHAATAASAQVVSHARRSNGHNDGEYTRF